MAPSATTNTVLSEAHFYVKNFNCVADALKNQISGEAFSYGLALEAWKTFLDSGLDSGRRNFTAIIVQGDESTCKALSWCILKCFYLPWQMEWNAVVSTV